MQFIIMFFPPAELMAECMHSMYGARLDAIPLSEKAEALRKRAPNKSDGPNPGSQDIWARKKRRTGELPIHSVLYVLWEVQCSPSTDV